MVWKQKDEEVWGEDVEKIVNVLIKMGNNNPYPEEIVDEASGVRVPNDKHEDWQKGYQAGWNKIAKLVGKGILIILLNREKLSQEAQAEAERKE